jgi:NhaA family Na+:H+ antiporter
VHASITGILLAFAIPFRGGSPSAPSYRIEHFLTKPVALGIMPLFALANTGILFSADFLRNLVTFNTAGIFTGLLVGKPLGIVLFAILSTKLGLAKLPDDVSFRDLLGTGFLGGIGFTMSIFIAILAFGETEIAQSSKIAIMLASLSSGVIGLWIFSRRSAEVPNVDLDTQV